MPVRMIIYKFQSHYKNTDKILQEKKRKLTKKLLINFFQSGTIHKNDTKKLCTMSKKIK
jgi:hypothetical protein